MPLLCISLLALLLLPLSLSGHSKRPPSDHWVIVQTFLNNADETTATLLQNLNKSCNPKPKVANCTPDVDVVRTLCNLTHKMENLKLNHTEKLVLTVQLSLQCLDKPPGRDKLQQKMSKQKDKKPKRTKSVRRRLCSAKAFLLAMTNCYKMLNTIAAEFTDGHPTPN